MYAFEQSHNSVLTLKRADQYRLHIKGYGFVDRVPQQPPRRRLDPANPVRANFLQPRTEGLVLLLRVRFGGGC